MADKFKSFVAEEEKWNYKRFSKLKDDEARWKEIEQLMKEFDWTYEMSDDHSVWRRWNDRSKEFYQMRKAMKMVDAKRYEKLNKKYNPW